MGQRMKSRKLWALIAGAGLNIFNGMLSAPIPEEGLQTITKLIGVYILGQGFADGVGNMVKKG